MNQANEAASAQIRSIRYCDAVTTEFVELETVNNVSGTIASHRRNDSAGTCACFCAPRSAGIGDYLGARNEVTDAAMPRQMLCWRACTALMARLTPEVAEPQ